MFVANFVASTLIVAASLAVAAPTNAPRSPRACTHYSLIDTRASGEPQGQSAVFSPIVPEIMKQVPGGKSYSTVYPATHTQDRVNDGVVDILRFVKAKLAEDPAHCFVLFGASQGATVTTEAMLQLKSNKETFNAVRGVYLVGSPVHKPGLACNIDTQGGDTSKYSIGILSVAYAGVTPEWVPRTLDMCNPGDLICDTVNIQSSTDKHDDYLQIPSTFTIGIDFGVRQLTLG